MMFLPSDIIIIMCKFADFDSLFKLLFTSKYICDAVNSSFSERKKKLENQMKENFNKNMILDSIENEQHLLVRFLWSVKDAMNVAFLEAGSDNDRDIINF